MLEADVVSTLPRPLRCSGPGRRRAGVKAGSRKSMPRSSPVCCPQSLSDARDSICFRASKYISGLPSLVPGHFLVPISENSAYTRNFIQSNSSLGCFFNPSLGAHSFKSLEGEVDTCLSSLSFSLLPALPLANLPSSLPDVYIYKSSIGYQ